MLDQREALRNIRTFPQLIKFLRDELDWPIESDDFEELTFDYTPEELGIDSENAAKIQEIKRLRPLSAGQPWGIFVVEFAKDKVCRTVQPGAAGPGADPPPRFHPARIPTKTPAGCPLRPPTPCQLARVRSRPATRQPRRQSQRNRSRLEDLS